MTKDKKILYLTAFARRCCSDSVRNYQETTRAFYQQKRGAAGFHRIGNHIRNSYSNVRNILRLLQKSLFCKRTDILPQDTPYHRYSSSNRNNPIRFSFAEKQDSKCCNLRYMRYRRGSYVFKHTRHNLL